MNKGSVVAADSSSTPTTTARPRHHQMYTLHFDSFELNSLYRVSQAAKRANLAGPVFAAVCSSSHSVALISSINWHFLEVIFQDDRRYHTGLFENQQREQGKLLFHTTIDPYLIFQMNIAKIEE